MRRMIGNTAAIVVGFFIAPLVAFLCALLVFGAAYMDFWRGLFGSLKQQNASQQQANEQLSVWDKHVAQLEAKKQNK